MAEETIGLTEVWTKSYEDLFNTSIIPSAAGAVNENSNTLGIFLQMLLSPLVFLGNGLILAAIRRSHAMKKVTYLFLGHMAVADLVFGTGVFIRFFLMTTENLDRYPCLLNMCFVITSGGSSTTGTVFLSLDSYLSVKNFISSKRVNSPRLAWGMIAGCWLIWTFLSLLSVALAAYNPTEQAPCIIGGGYYDGRYLTVIYFCHLLLIIYYQFNTLVITRRHLRQLTPQLQVCVDGNIETSAQRSTNRRRLRQLYNLSKLVGMVVGVFIVCWTPFMIAMSVVAACTENCSQLDKVSTGLGSLLGVSSVMNVVIFAAKSPKFRDNFRKTLLSCCSRISDTN